MTESLADGTELEGTGFIEVFPREDILDAIGDTESIVDVAKGFANLAELESTRLVVLTRGKVVFDGVSDAKSVIDVTEDSANPELESTRFLIVLSVKDKVLSSTEVTQRSTGMGDVGTDDVDVQSTRILISDRDRQGMINIGESVSIANVGVQAASLQVLLTLVSQSGTDDAQPGVDEIGELEGTRLVLDIGRRDAM